VTFELEVASPVGMGDSLLAWAEGLRVPLQDAMAIRLSDIVLQNFGDDGIDRPIQWKPLRAGYAAEFHDGDQTPREILTGALMASIDVELGNPEHSRVFTDCDYAAEQQWGVPSQGPYQSQYHRAHSSH
jgi:hypothetical protein